MNISTIELTGYPVSFFMFERFQVAISTNSTGNSYKVWFNGELVSGTLEAIALNKLREI